MGRDDAAGPRSNGDEAGGTAGTAGTGEALSLALLDTLLRTAPVGLGFVDADLRFVRVNEVLAELNGVPADEHLGRTVAEVLPHLADVVVPILRTTLETGEPTGEIRLANAGRHWAVSYYPVRQDGRVVGVGVVLRDTTDLDARARHLEAVAGFGQRALVADDFEGLLREGAELLVDVLGVDFVHVLEHERDAGRFVLRVAHGFDPPAALSTISDSDSLQPGYALHRRMPVLVPDLQGETRFQVNPLFHELHVASAATVVIRGPGWPFGVVGVSTCEPRRFSTAEVDFIQSVANVLGIVGARARVDAALRSERERLRLALEAGGLGDWEWDVASGQVSWSEQVHHLFGLRPGQFSGAFDDYVALIHPDDRAEVLAAVEAVRRGERDAFHVQHRTAPRDGAARWLDGWALARRDASGQLTGMIGVTADITDRMEAEYKQAILLAGEQEARADAEAARDRLEFLAEASEVLSASLDYRATLRRVAELAVPRLADWCAIDIVEGEGPLPTTSIVVHSDPAKVAMAEQLRADYPPDPEAEIGVPAVIRTGEPLLIPVIDDQVLVAAAVDDEHLRLMRGLTLKSTMVVPLTARGRTLGTITLLYAESGRVYADDDLALALDLARRAAVAIDNARLYEERSKVAEALQRSLLPPRRPEIPGLDVAVRYRPIGHGAEIGGDFYDVFEASEGSWAVVIGDVCGKGTAAADLTGLARDTIRGLSIREKAPRRVLGVLNEVILRREEEGRFLTVAMARIEVDAAGARMRIACSGHPPPLAVRADGSVDEAGVPSLLLGLFPEVSPVDAHVELGPGDLLVFYTDGVVEAHGPDGLYGEPRLRELLAGLAGAPAEDVAQAVIDSVDAYRPGPPQDDVAVVVLRVPPASA